MYRILYIELKNFIGLRKINNEENIYKTSFKQEINNNTIMIFGENGKGKTTLLENLTPYSNMLSRNVKDSINYPAHKIINFINIKNNKIYTFEVYWNSETETKGYIKIDGEYHENTKKGNITEYNFLVDKMFGEFNKFKHSLFLQQGVLEIVKAKPSERIKIINNFMQDLQIYTDIKKNTDTKINDLKNKHNIKSEEIEDFITYENRYKDIQKAKEKNKEKIYEDKILEFKEIEDTYLEYKDNINNLLRLNKEIKTLEIDIENLKNQDLIKQKEETEIKLKKSQEDLNNFENIEDLEKKEKKLLEEKYNLNNQLSALNEFDDKISTEYTISDIENKLNDDKIEILEKTLNKTKENLNILKEKNNLNKQIEELNIKLKKYQDTLNKEKPEKIVDNSLNYYNEINNKLNELREEYLKQNNIIKEKNKIEDEIKKIRIINTDDLVNEIKKTNENINNYKHNKNLLDNYKKTLNNSKEESNCEHCGSKLNIFDLEKKIKDLESYFQTNFSLDEMEEKILTLNNKLNNNISQETLLKKAKEDLKKLNPISDIELEKLVKEGQKYKELKIEIDNYKIYLENTELIRKNINDIEQEIVFLEKKLNSLNITDIDNNKTEENLNSEIISIKENISIEKNIKKSYELYLNRINKYNLDKDSKIFILIEDTKNNITIISNNLIEIKEKINTINNVKKQIQALIEKKSFLIEQNLEYSNKESNLKNNIKKRNEFKDIKEESFKEIESLYLTYKKDLEKLHIEIIELKKDEEYINSILDKYLKIQEELKDIEGELKVLSKIKNYSDRIKKASVTEFFSNITEFINKILSAESGTLNEMRIKISQPKSTSFDILVENGDTPVKDISLLSGAEQGTVARAIYFALAQFNNFGIIWLDECDGMLSDTNKQVFIDMLLKMKDLIGLEQIFLISHNKNIINKADEIIYL